MLELPKRGQRVAFKPPENAYTLFCKQAQVSGLTGTLLSWNENVARVLFTVGGKAVAVNVNACYLYQE